MYSILNFVYGINTTQHSDFYNMFLDYFDSENNPDEAQLLAELNSALDGDESYKSLQDLEPSDFYTEFFQESYCKTLYSGEGETPSYIGVNIRTVCPADVNLSLDQLMLSCKITNKIKNDFDEQLFKLPEGLQRLIIGNNDIGIKLIWSTS